MPIYQHKHDKNRVRRVRRDKKKKKIKGLLCDTDRKS